MGLRPRRPLRGGGEREEARGREYFDEDLHRILSLVGTRTIDVGSISAAAVTTFTITVTGAKTGMDVAVGAPSGLEASLLWCANVTAANTVTVRLYNPTGGAIDPASATWTARVFA